MDMNTQTAINAIKNDLQLAFPCIAFEVRSRRRANHSFITVAYKKNTADAAIVTEIVEKYSKPIFKHPIIKKSNGRTQTEAFNNLLKKFSLN